MQRIIMLIALVRSIYSKAGNLMVPYISAPFFKDTHVFQA